MANLETVGVVVTMLGESYPGRFTVTENTALVWQRLLADIPDDALMAAAMERTVNGAFPPSVAELRNACFSMVEPEQLTAGDAWSLVTRAISKYGSYDPGPQLAKAELPPLVWRCVEALNGWRYLCLSEDTMADRAQFFRVYETFATRDRESRRMLPEVREVRMQLQAGAIGYLPDGMYDRGEDYAARPANGNGAAGATAAGEER